MSNKFKLSIVLASAVTMIIPVAGFAMTSFEFDALVFDGKPLDVTGRVLDGTIIEDVTRVQTYTVATDSGQLLRVPNQNQIEHNMDAVIRHCKSNRAYYGLDTTKCGTESTGRTRQ